MSDYCCASNRKSKNDKRAKRRFGIYKKGGKYRSANVSLTNSANKKN